MQRRNLQSIQQAVMQTRCERNHDWLLGEDFLFTHKGEHLLAKQTSKKTLIQYNHVEIASTQKYKCLGY